MTDKSKPLSQEARQASLAPETHNDEQDDHRSQAQEVAQQAQDPRSAMTSPTDSRKGDGTTPIGSSEQDTIDRMRDMESSGRVDMGAFNGEPNHDDNVDKYGEDNKLDGLRGDGT
ncbi:hypothetical protein [Parerythrobacter jejuensis]|uniref:Uncharacterized protein n=1 Tax=Parerythrobacter jejuensis TaxID=795812 RepID=A0A845AQE9_9SPHN|nr:hypothetical protein [Parerythrobacter jejuensis]MXP30726.1 hypothetical protein [Parerythrobacter jejuensis]MXP33486.1 hypothetical protein [Parerythrobacter jejuensis]